jgi:hypothetical protein
MSSSLFRVETAADRADRLWRQEQGRRTALADRALVLGLTVESAESLDLEAPTEVIMKAALGLAEGNDTWSRRLADEQATLNRLQVDLAALNARHSTLRTWADEIGIRAAPPPVEAPVEATAVEAARVALGAVAEDNGRLTAAVVAFHQERIQTTVDTRWAALAIADPAGGHQVASGEHGRAPLRERLNAAVATWPDAVPATVLAAAARLETTVDHDAAEEAVSQAESLLAILLAERRTAAPLTADAPARDRSTSLHAVDQFCRVLTEDLGWVEVEVETFCPVGGRLLRRVDDVEHGKLVVPVGESACRSVAVRLGGPAHPATMAADAAECQRQVAEDWSAVRHRFDERIGPAGPSQRWSRSYAGQDHLPNIGLSEAQLQALQATDRDHLSARRQPLKERAADGPLGAPQPLTPRTVP